MDKFVSIRFLRNFLLLILAWFAQSAIVGGALAGAALPVSFEPGRLDVATEKIVGAGPNVRWAVPIGMPTYAAPVPVDGKVLIGTLNNFEYDTNRNGSRSVLLCFDDRNGTMLWQLPMPKNHVLPYVDSYCVGISSTPLVLGDRAYLTANSGEILCLDMNALADGNDGPFRDEAALFTFNRETPKPLGKTDADVIWLFDMYKTFRCRPHDTNNSDLIAHEGLLYVKTGNAPDHTHVHLPNPEAPSLLVCDLETGEPLARDDFDIGSDISHGQWCNPTLVQRNGKSYILYGGGNGVVYCTKTPDRKQLVDAQRKYGKTYDNQTLPRLPVLWKFHGDPRAQVGSTEEVPPFVMGMRSPSYTCLPPPRYDATTDRVFVLFGHDAWNGARPFRSWLAAIQFCDTEFSDAAGDITKTALAWGTPNIEGGAITPPALADGLLYFGDRKGKFYCYDIKTGEKLWTLPLRGDIWAAPLLVEGKIYVGTDRRIFYTLRAGRTPEILSSIQMPGPIFAPAAARNNTLYVAGDGFLYAVEK